MSVGLVAVQLGLGPDDVARPEALEAALAAQVARALAQTGTAEHRLVVAPEAIGLAALVALAPVRAREAPTVGQLLARSALGRPLSMLRGALDARTLEPRHAALVGLAPDVDRWVRETFARIARREQVYLVGGSHVRVDERGEVIAAAYAFNPDGRPIATVDKVNLLAGLEDRTRGGLGLARAEAHRLPRIATPFGELAVLIGYDGFAQPDSPHERFVPLGPAIAARGPVAVVANPAASPWAWTDEVAARWRSRGLRATLAGGGVARWGVTAHLVGRILDVSFEGESEIVRAGPDGNVEVVARAGRPDAGCAVTWVAHELC
jgi:predicted amidohydrolase